MAELNIIELFTGTSLPIAITIYVLYQMRIDRADALRRETAYSEALRADRKEFTDLVRDMIETNTLMERHMHEIKNTLQRLNLDEGRHELAQRRRGAHE